MKEKTTTKHTSEIMKGVKNEGDIVVTPEGRPFILEPKLFASDSNALRQYEAQREHYRKVLKLDDQDS